MLNEREKCFGHYTTKLKESFFDPRTYLAIGSLGVAGASLRLNKENLKTNKLKEHDYKQSVETNQKLISALDKLSNKIDETNSRINNNSNRGSISPDNRKRGGFFSFFRRKNYSVESGSFSGRKQLNTIPYLGPSTVVGAASAVVPGTIIGGATALLGGKGNGLKNFAKSVGISGLMGAGLGAFGVWLFNKAIKSNFYSKNVTKYSSKELLEDLKGSLCDANDVETAEDSAINLGDVIPSGRGAFGRLYDVNKNPKDFPVSALVKNNVLVLFINSVNKKQLKAINEVLNSYCCKYQNADYTSSVVEKDKYIVEVKLVNNIRGGIVSDLITSGIRVNIITERSKFNSKLYSMSEEKSEIVDSTFKGGMIGTALTAAAYPILHSFKSKTFNPSSARHGVTMALAGLVVGAGLGLLCSSIKAADRNKNQHTTVNNRLLPQVLNILSNSGFKEGKDFTRDPKVATDRKIKVCLCISKYSNDLRLAINHISDPKLNDITNQLIKNYPNASISTTKADNRFNDITISTVSDKSVDAGLIEGTAEYFIRRGFPVYILEVG